MSDRPEPPPAPEREPRLELGRWKRRLLDLDARLDHALFSFAVWLGAKWSAICAFSDRFHVAGLRRLGVELASEGLTLGAAGAVLMLALALPAFQETADEDWLKKSELAVVFLDRYGNKLGERGIRHNDTVPLEDYPDHLVQAVLATEDRRHRWTRCYPPFAPA